MIEPGVTDSGSLSVAGGVLVEGGDVHLGGLNNGYAPLVLHYMENGSERQMVVYASASAVEYLWKEGNSNPALAQAKMSLAGDNTLRLYDASGVPSIVLSPVTGEINASGGIRLPDDTLIDGISALRSTALYNASGQVVAEVDQDGILNVTGGIILGGNATTKLTESSASYLSGILEKLGYQENPIEPTAVQVMIGATATADFKVAVDAAGNRYIAGSFSGSSLDLGSATIGGVSTGVNQFVAKFSPEGNLLWSKRWTTSSGALYALELDASGNIYVGGALSGTAGQSVVLSGVTVSLLGSSDGYVLKLNSSGVGQWAKVIGDIGSDYVRGISVDTSGNVYVVGEYNQTVNQTIDLAGVTVTARGSWDGYVLKLNSSGIGQWAKAIGSTGYDYARGVSVDASGNVYVVGEYNQTANQTVNLAGLTVTARGSSDGYVLKLNSSGVGQWAKVIGNNNIDYAYGVDVDSSGNVYVVGNYNRPAGQSIDLAGLTVTALGNHDGYVLKLDSSGVGQWAKVIGSTSYDYARAVSVDASNRIYVVGYSIAPVSAVLSLANISKAALGGISGYILKLDGGGVGEWAKVVPASFSSAYATPTGELLVGGVSSALTFMLGDAVIAGNYTEFIAAMSVDDAPVERALSGAAELFWGNSFSTGVASVALGDNALASGDYSVSLGRNAAATSTGASAIGTFANASGTNSFAAGGEYNSASGSHSFVGGGSYNNASGSNSFIGGGGDNQAFGYNSAVIGGLYGSAGGVGAVVVGGESNYAPAYNSFASGVYSTTQAAYSFVIGSSNLPQGHMTAWVPTDDLFVVGNGDPYSWGDDRSNAFIVQKDGATRAAGTFEAKGGVRVPPSGDIPMGAFTAGNNPADLGAGLRYVEQ